MPAKKLLKNQLRGSSPASLSLVSRSCTQRSASETLLQAEQRRAGLHSRKKHSTCHISAVHADAALGLRHLGSLWK